MTNYTKPFSNAITERSGYIKKHSTYCTMKQLMVLKSMMDNGDWSSRRQFFDNVMGNNNLHPHLSPDDWAKGIEAIFEPNITLVNQVSQKFRKRIERIIHSVDLNSAGRKVSTVSEMSRPAAMRLKTVVAFSEEFPDNEVNKNLLRRMRDNHDNILHDVMSSKDINDSTLKGIYFGRGSYSLPDHVTSIMEKNGGIQSLVKDMIASYEDYVDEKALQNNMIRKDRMEVSKHGRIALWKNLREKTGNVVGGIGQTIKQGIAIVAISMMGIGAMEMSKQQDVEMSYSPSSSSSLVSAKEQMTGSDSSRGLHGDIGLGSDEGKVVPGKRSASSDFISEEDSITQISYTVKEGDTLWSLAEDHLHAMSGSAPSDNDVANFMARYGHESQHVIHPGDEVMMEIDEDFFEPLAGLSMNRDL